MPRPLVLRPVLISLLAASLGVFLLNALPAWFDEVLWTGLLAAGAGLWWWGKPGTAAPPKPISLEVALREVEELLERWQEESPNPQAGEQLRQQLAQLQLGPDPSPIQLAVWGRPGVGKTTLVQALAPTYRVWDPPTGSLGSLPPSVDLVLFVGDGDLEEGELNQVRELRATDRRTLVVYNKKDLHLPQQQFLIQQQLCSRLRGLISSADVVATSAAPNPLMVRKYLQGGSIQEFPDYPQPELQSLRERLRRVLTQEEADLRLGRSRRQVARIKGQICQAIIQERRPRALALIDQAQWLPGVAAFVSPLPLLDLLATGAVNIQLVLDLGNLYHQGFSRDQARAITTTIAGVMLKLGVVEVSTQVVTSFLKTNAVTFVAAGAVQGLSAAYLTRLGALGLVAYLEEQPPFPAAHPLSLERLGELVRQSLGPGAWRNLPAFALQGIGRLAREARGSAT